MADRLERGLGSGRGWDDERSYAVCGRRWSAMGPTSDEAQEQETATVGSVFAVPTHRYVFFVVVPV